MEKLFEASRSLARPGTEFPTDRDGLRVDGFWWVEAIEQWMAGDLKSGASFAILGEPGAGKSEMIRQTVAANGGAVWLPMDEIDDPDRFTGVLEDSLIAAGAHAHRTLVIDGIDESPLPPKPLVRRLGKSLEGIRNVRVIVGCRSAAWTSELQGMLERTIDGFSVYELLPLTVTDIEQAARDNDLDSDAFLAAIRQTGAAALAWRPLTLNLLLRIFREEGRLRDEPKQLFETGLLLLACEPDSQRAEELQPRGSAEQRLEVAARIAASMMMAGSSALVDGVSSEQADLMLGAFCAGTEPIDAGEFPVTRDLVVETVRSGLFASRGAGRFHPSHASFAAFLAARYLIRRGLTETQIRALLTRTSETGRVGVPSQLKETAAWLVALHPERNLWVIDVDPEAVLSYSNYVRDPRACAALADRLLSDDHLATRVRRSKWPLGHKLLVEQLTPALTAPLVEDAGPDFSNPVSRRAATAIDIARAAQDSRVLDLLLDLVNASKLNPYLRCRAAYAAVDLDLARAAGDLRSLLFEINAHPERDPDDDLRGISLEACHEVLTTEELFASLTPPKRGNYFGAYEAFLHKLCEAIDDSRAVELVQAMRSADGGILAVPDRSDDGSHRLHLGRDRRSDGFLGRLVHRLVQSESIRRDHLDTVAWLLSLALRRRVIPVLPPVVFEKSEPADTQRRNLVAAVAALLPARDAYLIARPMRVSADPEGNIDTTHGSLLTPEDFAWLFSLAGEVPPESLRQLISHTYDASLEFHQEIAWAHHNSEEFAWVGRWFDPVAISSEEADQLREIHSWQDEGWEGSGDLERRIALSWATCRSGDSSVLPDLLALLRIDPDTGHPVDVLMDDLALWPGLVRSEIDLPDLAEACLGHLSDAKPPQGDWRNQAGPISVEAVNQYVMLTTVIRTLGAAEASARLPAAAWKRLAPVVIRFPKAPTDDDQAPHSQLLGILSSKAPDVLRDEQLLWIQHAHQAGWAGLGSLSPLSAVYDDDVHVALVELTVSIADRLCEATVEFEQLPKDALPGTDEAKHRASVSQRRSGLQTSLATTLHFLLERRRPADGSGLIQLFTDQDRYCVDVRVRAGLALMRRHDVEWSQVWERLEDDEDFGRALVEVLARWDEDSMLSILSAGEIERLWEWLEQRWDSDSDTWEDGPVAVDRMVRDFRDGLLSELEQRSSPESLKALSRMAATYPGDYRLREKLENAEERYRAETWSGTSLKDFMIMIEDANTTVVHDADSLFRAVCSLLDSFEGRMHDLGLLLWDEIPVSGKGQKSLWRPKSEAAVSAMLRDHLNTGFKSGLIVNREVLVRQTTGQGHGLSVDVLVSSGQSDAEGRLPQCPIEVKGNWNPGLITDLREQLINDYMDDLATSRGAYLCAWFDADQWTDAADGRRAAVKRREASDILAQLEAVAREAATEKSVEVSVRVMPVPRPEPSRRAEAIAE